MDGKRTVQQVEGARRIGREELEAAEANAEISEAGSGFQKADAATLAQRRMLRLKPEARQQQQQAAAGGGAFSNISEPQQKQSSSSDSSSSKPFVWGSGFYNPPQPQHAKPDYNLVAGGDKDNANQTSEAQKKVEEKSGNAWGGVSSSSNNSAWGGTGFNVAPATGVSAANPFAAGITTTTNSSNNPFGGNTNFSFSFAPPPTSFGNNKKEEQQQKPKKDEDGSDDDGEGSGEDDADQQQNNNNSGFATTTASAAAFAGSAVIVPTTSEADGNDVVYNTDSCKLYHFTKDPETGKSVWKERGAGLFKILKSKEDPKKARLLMRNTQTKKAILNCPVNDSLKLGQVQELQLMFTTADTCDDITLAAIAEDPENNKKESVQSFLLRANKLAGKEVVESIVKIIKELQGSA
jgi:hypothetical protein